MHASSQPTVGSAANLKQGGARVSDGRSIDRSVAQAQASQRAACTPAPAPPRLASPRLASLSPVARTSQATDSLSRACAAPPHRAFTADPTTAAVCCFD